MVRANDTADYHNIKTLTRPDLGLSLAQLATNQHKLIL